MKIEHITELEHLEGCSFMGDCAGAVLNFDYRGEDLDVERFFGYYRAIHTESGQIFDRAVEI